METRAHHVMIGAFALAVVAVAMGFALWLGKTALDRQWNVYRVIFEESVTGLTVGGAVQYNGIQVGEVRRLQLDPDDPSRVWATVRIGAEVPVRTDTVAKLSFTGVTGVAIIQLSGGKPESPLLLGSEEDPAVIQAQPSAIAQLLSSSEDIASTTSQVLVRINRLLSKQNVDRVSATLEHLETLSRATAESESDIRTVLAEAANASQRLAELLDGAESAMRRLDTSLARADGALSEELPKLSAKLNSSLDSIERLTRDSAELVQDNRAALTGFTQEGLAQVGPTLAELRALLEDWRRISQKLEQNPPGFVLGRDQLPEYQPE
ncbi:MlaD family protein [Pseudomarimonas salicorniae]|uniref:MlaD family protein n=1 Tax=Pseudomarimonas salicorniae TaxID=2933270 RepID=A0ABT0GHK2_9GAMM|nr:MlaD family protein [Lysobacter sp. CAU 1642]MCK7594016.1 MlaD family protein [Lysobacter sp. CAU 1642]